MAMIEGCYARAGRRESMVTTGNFIDGCIDRSKVRLHTWRMGPRVKFVFSLLSLALLTAAFVPALHADTIVGNINGGTCGDPTVCGLPISGATTGNWSSAVAFTPSANYTLTGAAAVLFNALNDTTVDFSIYSSSGNLPDASLGEFGSATLLAGQEGTFTASATTSISLLAGTQYWMVLSGGDDLTEVLWEQNAFFPEPWADSTDAIDRTQWMTTVLPAYAQFSVFGTPTGTTPPAATPEPASALLLVTAAGLGWLIYNKRLKLSC